jgi:hypothetical protein
MIKAAGKCHVAILKLCAVLSPDLFTKPSAGIPRDLDHNH